MVGGKCREVVGVDSESGEVGDCRGKRGSAGVAIYNSPVA